jgi:hypothetical protein
MNVTIELIRDFIQTFGLYMQVFACIVYILYTRKTTAFFYCLIAIIISTGIQYVLEKELLSLAQNPKFEQVVYNAWYLGFAYADAVFVIAVIYICKKKALRIDNTTRMILISYVTLGAMQVARYFDRIILESNTLGELYSLVVPTINVSVTLLVCANVLFVLLSGRKNANTN